MTDDCDLCRGKGFVAGPFAIARCPNGCPTPSDADEKALREALDEQRKRGES